MFFIQACQGDQLDRGVTLSRTETDGSPHSYRIPAHADFLIAYSTVSGEINCFSAILLSICVCFFFVYSTRLGSYLFNQTFCLNISHQYNSYTIFSIRNIFNWM